MYKILLATLALAGTAFAAEDSPLGPPEPKRYGTVEYVTGEVGLEESDVVAAADYNLGLTFASKGGEFVGDVHVVVTNARQETLLEVDTSGPRLLARLPPDRYRVAASFAGRSLAREAVIDGKERTELEFLWPLNDSLARAQAGASSPRTAFRAW